MDTVTYPDPLVQKELENWILERVNVAERPEVARAFGVPAVPEAVAVDGAGKILGRIADFVEPAPFRDRLLRLRPGSVFLRTGSRLAGYTGVIPWKEKPA